jgi:hypothetical protein
MEEEIENVKVVSLEEEKAVVTVVLEEKVVHQEEKDVQEETVEAIDVQILEMVEEEAKEDRKEEVLEEILNRCLIKQNVLEEVNI